MIGDVVRHSDELVKRENCLAVSWMYQPGGDREIFIPRALAGSELVRLVHHRYATGAIRSLARGPSRFLPAQPSIGMRIQACRSCRATQCREVLRPRGAIAGKSATLVGTRAPSAPRSRCRSDVAVPRPTRRG